MMIRQLTAFAASMVMCLSASSSLFAADSTESLSLNQWVRSVDGAVRGRIVAPKASGALEAVSDAQVVISRRDGWNIRITTDQNGQFQARDLESGVYALSVWQKRMLAACALHVIDDSHDPAGRYPTSAIVSIADVDRPTMKTAIIRYLPASVATKAGDLNDVNFTDLATKVQSHGNLARISKRQGQLVGRIFAAGATGSNLKSAGSSNVFVFRDEMQIDRALTNANGEFAFDNLTPGVYSILAIGPQGVGLIGFELTAESPVANRTLTTEDGQYVTAVQESADELSMQLAPVPEAIESMDTLMAEENVEVIEVVDGVPLAIDDACCAESLCDTCMSGGSTGSGAMGGGGGGGGGGGFGGGFGALIGLAAIAAINDDDNAVVIPPPASPTNP